MPKDDGNTIKSPIFFCIRSSVLRYIYAVSAARCFVLIRCTIRLVSFGPQLVRPPAKSERNWLPLVVAMVIVSAAVGGLIFYYERGPAGPRVTPIHAVSDPYAASLSIGNLTMSESSSLSGGKVTYLDGRIANHGNRTATGITVQVLFRDSVHEVAGNETQSLQIIRTREPYVDLEPLSAAPLKPGDAADFRLVFDAPAVPDQWDGNYPDLRVVHVDLR